jgi:anti-anti-sigma factor
MGLTTAEIAPGVARITLEGRLDAAALGSLELPFTATVSAGDRHVLVDLSQVPFCASLGLRLLIANARVVQRRGRVMVLFGAQAAVAEVFETVALAQLMPIVATEAAALALLPA